MTVTTVTATVPPAALDGGADEFDRLQAVLDLRFLAEIGWDADKQIIRPPAGHPHLGYRTCLVVGCKTISSRRDGLCQRCSQSFKASELTVEAFIATGYGRSRHHGGELLCVVPGCPRSRRTVPSMLCSAHYDQRHKRLRLPLEAFLAHPEVCPLPSLGPCRVVACPRQADTRRGLCHAHEGRWARHRQKDPDADFDRWCEVAAPPHSEATIVALGGLPPLVQVQLLYGVQERSRGGGKTKLHALRTSAASTVSVTCEFAGTAGRFQPRHKACSGDAFKLQERETASSSSVG